MSINLEHLVQVILLVIYWTDDKKGDSSGSGEALLMRTIT